jgi:hypothetical protein
MKVTNSCRNKNTYYLYTDHGVATYNFKTNMVKYKQGSFTFESLCWPNTPYENQVEKKWKFKSWENERAYNECCSFIIQLSQTRFSGNVNYCDSNIEKWDCQYNWEVDNKKELTWDRNCNTSCELSIDKSMLALHYSFIVLFTILFVVFLLLCLNLI